MKLKLYTYIHEANGLALQVIPETEPEQAILHALWKFGRLDITNTADNRFSVAGFVVKAFQNTAAEAAKRDAAAEPLLGCESPFECKLTSLQHQKYATHDAVKEAARRNREEFGNSGAEEETIL